MCCVIIAQTHTRTTRKQGNDYLSEQGTVSTSLLVLDLWCWTWPLHGLQDLPMSRRVGLVARLLMMNCRNCRATNFVGDKASTYGQRRVEAPSRGAGSGKPGQCQGRTSCFLWSDHRELTSDWGTVNWLHFVIFT